MSLYFILFVFIINKTYGFEEFTCRKLNILKEKIGEAQYIPSNSTTPLRIPINFNCTIFFIVPKSAYLRVSVLNSLANRDYIEFTDSLGYVRRLTSAAIANEELFATTGQGHLRIVTGPVGNSKALLLFEWIRLPTSSRCSELKKNASGQNVDLNSILQEPITFKAVESHERVALTIAHSGYILDHFDSFFIFDGPDTDSNVVGRMSDHIIVPYVATNQSVTVVGLTSLIVYSNLMANIESNIVGFRKYESAVIIDQQGTIIDSINQTIAVTFIAKDGNELYMTYLKFNEIENDKCAIRAISGTPSPISRDLVTYTTTDSLQSIVPQQFPASLFSIIVTDCSIYIVISKNRPDDFYNVQSGRIGYAFTPSYLDRALTSDMNFTLVSNVTLTYSTVVEYVNVFDDEQLSINVFNSRNVSAMSMIVTGNQTGGSARGTGTSASISFYGTKQNDQKGAAKVKYYLSNNPCSYYHLSLTYLIFIIISLFVL